MSERSLVDELRAEADAIVDNDVNAIEMGHERPRAQSAWRFRIECKFRAAADRIEELERELARTRRQWVDGADPMCEDVCLDVCQGPCGITGEAS